MQEHSSVVSRVNTYNESVIPRADVFCRPEESRSEYNARARFLTAIGMTTSAPYRKELSGTPH